MKMILIYFLSVLIMTMIMMMTTLILSKKSMITMNKSSPFECGFNPMSMKRLPFSINFFMIAIIFLIFDVEIMILLPSILTMKITLIKYWSLSMILFLLILILGLYYEWNNGLLNWKN